MMTIPFFDSITRVYAAANSTLGWCNDRDVASDVSSSDLFKRGNYSMLRLLMIISAAGPDGIPTRKLLNEIGSHATYTQKVIYKAQKQGLIKRRPGEEPGPGQFPPISNVLTNKGRQLLQSQFLLVLKISTPTLNSLK